MTTRSDDRDLSAFLEIALWLGALVLAALAAAALLKDRTESLAVALGAGSGLLAMGAGFLRWPALRERLGRPLWRNATWGLVATWAVWGAIALATVVVYASDGWDESDHYLSGLALRGYPTTYAASRPPVTHFVAAIFADAPQVASAALIAALIVLLSAWGIRRWGWAGAALPLAMLATQNVLLERFLGFTSELPATVLLVAAFFFLARERFLLSGVLFALATLARWNLGVVPVVLAVIVVLRFGWKSAARFVAGGAAIGIVFLALSFACVAHPIQQIVKGNMVAAYAWAEAGTAPPDFVSRSRFYLGHAFFLTPLALLALVWCLRTWRRNATGDAGDWCLRCAIPAGIAVYALAMINIGAHFPRFMAPVIPLALLVLTDFLFALPSAWRVTAACITAAWGIWPADTLLLMRNKLAFRPLFSPALREAVAREVPRQAQLCAPAILPLANAGGLPPMVELRRFLLFPQAVRNTNGEIFAITDPAEAVRSALAAAPNNAYFLVPIDQENLLSGGRIVAKDDRWVLWQAAHAPTGTNGK